jgi:hypothetical protein
VQDGGDGPVPFSLRRPTTRREHDPVRISEQIAAFETGEGKRRGEETHGGGVEEREASRAPGRAEPWVDGGVAVEVRAAAKLLLVYFARAHAGTPPTPLGRSLGRCRLGSAPRFSSPDSSASGVYFSFWE